MTKPRREIEGETQPGSRELRRDVVRAVIIVALGAACGIVWRPDALNSASIRADDQAFQKFIAPTVTVDEIRPSFEEGELVVVDARKRPDFERGHIPGALALYDDPVKPEFRAIRRFLPLDRPCIVVGRNDSDHSAARVASRLRLLGLEGTRTLAGGMSAWRAAGLPIVGGWDMDPILEAAR